MLTGFGRVEQLIITVNSKTKTIFFMDIISINYDFQQYIKKYNNNI
jgi:hypothetical protein